MSDKNKKVFAILLIAGLLLIGASLFLFSKKQTNKQSQEQRLARLDNDSGSVTILRKNLTQKEIVENYNDLFDLDSVETSDTGSATVTVENFRVKLMSSSLITLEKVTDNVDHHILLILKRGDVKIENFGTEGELYIAKNGERVSAIDYNGSQLAYSPVEAATPTPTENKLSQTLSEEDIFAILNGHKTSFQKCYRQLIQTIPDAKGEVSMAFTIETTGKISGVQITSQNLTQEEFKRCLSDLLSRIEFKSFTGQPISTLFPLKFE